MNIGLYFGSFNPIHIGHLIIANHVLNETNIERIWFIVSPQNPLKKSNSLLNEFDRLHMVRLAVQDDNRMKCSDIEFNLSRPSFTTNTLAFLSEKYPEHKFSIIMGSDSYQNLDKWKNFETIVSNYPIYVYKRDGHEINKFWNHEPTILNAPLIQVSATQIRDQIKAGKSIRYLVPEIVREEIETRKFYKQKG
ncbi:MAG TPA: nicotinate (nicotinamide) nucleotide adenylyltransferase [Chitinophagaceae bacterium]|jgi:nicotinate-nucleotide adenylyltransferase|nr:nicotinate (nicotinamide) nucleotide adenylyltransferase [Chitinophagaceae bacterium]